MLQSGESLFCLFTLYFKLPDNRLYDSTNQLRSENLKLSVENEQLRSGGSVAANSTQNATAAKIQALEKRLLTQQEELTDLHKRKGENSQMIVDLNIKLEKQNRLLVDRDARFDKFIGFYFVGWLN